MIPGLGRSPGEGNGNPHQYSCLENSMDRGAWEAIVQGVVKELDTTECLSMYRSIYTHTHTFSFIFIHTVIYTHIHIFSIFFSIMIHRILNIAPCVVR